jgi:GNAT superfamily N-acetyltransferase
MEDMDETTACNRAELTHYIHLFDLPEEILITIFSAENAGVLSHTILTQVCKDLGSICRPLIPKNELVKYALIDGNLKILEWAISIGCPPDAATCESAAFYGHLHIVKWAYANRGIGQLTVQLCANAAAGGHIEILKWARSQGCPWNYLTAANAASRGQVDTLKWALEHGCPYDSIHMLAWRGTTFGYQKIADCVREYERAR